MSEAAREQTMVDFKIEVVVLPVADVDRSST
jgi:hypothetical protein